jgi:hypothetical protein
MKCASIGRQTCEVDETKTYPAGDVMNAISRGAITKDWNRGLRNPQAKQMTYDMYNGGCINPNCVANSGYTCEGRQVGDVSPQLDQTFARLKVPLVDDDYEYKPPPYMMGIKGNSPNSTSGWAMQDGTRAYIAEARR